MSNDQQPYVDGPGAGTQPGQGSSGTWNHGGAGSQPGQEPHGTWNQPGIGAQPGYGQFSQELAQPPRRSTAMTVIGVIFAAFTGLVLLGMLANLSRGTFGPTGDDGARAAGYYIGALIMLVVPAAIAYACLTSHRRRAKRSVMR